MKDPGRAPVEPTRATAVHQPSTQPPIIDRINAVAAHCLTMAFDPRVSCAVHRKIRQQRTDAAAQADHRRSPR